MAIVPGFGGDNVLARVESVTGGLAGNAAITRRRCCPTARCWWRGDSATVVYLSSAELYDPATGNWSSTGSLGAARSITRRRCCPTARCWWREESVAVLP